MNIEYRPTDSDYVAAQTAWLLRHPRALGRSLIPLRWRWRKQFAKSPLASADMSAIVDERGVTLSAKGEQKSHYWAGFSEIYESGDVVMFEKGYGDFVYLPLRAMSAAQLAELVRLAQLATNCKVRLALPLA